MMFLQRILLFVVVSAACEALIAPCPGYAKHSASCRLHRRAIPTFSTSLLTPQEKPLISLRESVSDDDLVEETSTTPYSKAYSYLGAASLISWTAVSVFVFRRHPDPRFAQLTLRHNILTTAQALAFPLPVLASTFLALRNASEVGWTRLQSATYRRLNLGLAAASLWLGASCAFPAVFAFGYDLIPFGMKLVATPVHLASAILALRVWGKTVAASGPNLGRVVQGMVGSLWKLPPSEATDDPDETGKLLASFYALTTVGFVWFTALPVLSYYPLATVPSILGKRLTRPAAAFTWLAAVSSYCLKDAADRDRLKASTFRILQRGLMTGSALHLTLVALKLIGIDGGGFVIPGDSLWEVYPAMMAVPFALGVSLMVHALSYMAGWMNNNSYGGNEQ